MATQTIGLVTFATTMGITTNNGDVLVNADGALTINSAINAGTADVRLAADGNITQSTTGTITADELGVQQQNAAGGSITLDDANDVNTLAASNAFAGGTITFNDVDGLIIGTVATQSIGLVTFTTMTGLSTNDGDVLVNADGALTINSAINAGTADVMLAADGNITQLAAGTITADELGVRQQSAAAGSITLDDANDVNTLAASNAFAGGTITFNDVDGLTIGTVATQTIGLVTFAATTGLGTNNGDVLVNADGALTINSAIDAGTADVMLAADGNITQSATGTITADELGIRQQSEAAGSITLDDANDVNTLAASNAFAGGTITFNDVDGLTIGTVATQTIGLVTFATTTGLSTNNGNFTLKAGGAVLIDDDVTAGTGTVRIETSTGGITQNAGDVITAAALGLRNADAGNIVLNEANDVNTLAVLNAASGTVEFHDVDDLIVGQVAAGALFGLTTGVVTGDGTHIGGDILIDADGVLTVNEPITTTGGTGGLISVDSAVLNATLTAGAGDITLDGGGLDLVINVDQTSNTTLTYTADRDIIIRATVTANGAGSDLVLTADNDADGVGGFWLDEATSAENAQLVAGRDVTIAGSDLFATATAGVIDSVRIDIDGTSTQVQAGRHIALASNGVAPVTADIVIDGVMTATTGTIDVNASDLIFVRSDQTAGTDILYRDDVQLTNDLALTAGRDITFFEKLDDDGVNVTGSDLAITAGRNVLFTGAVGSNAGDVFESLTVSDAESIRFQSTVEMNGKIDLTTTLNGGGLAGTVQFDNTVTTTDGGFVEVTNAGKLTIVNNANFTLDGSFTQNGAGTVDLGADIHTSGDAVSFLRAVTLIEDAILIDTRTGGATTGNVTFTSTVDSQAAEANSLTINTGAVTRFNADVGSTTALKSLTTDAGGTTSLNGDVTTTQTQTFNDAVVLTNNVLLTSTGAGASGNVTFVSTVNDNVAGTHSLTVNTAGTTRFNSTVGNSAALASLTTDGPGLVSLNGNVTTTGSQTYGDQAVITNDVILTSTGSGNITFQNTVNDSAAGAHDLTVNTAGTTRFNSTVGQTTALQTITTDGPGTTELNGNVTTTNAQTYGDDVVLTNSVILDAGTSSASDIAFAKTVDTNGNNLTLDAGPNGDIDCGGSHLRRRCDARHRRCDAGVRRDHRRLADHRRCHDKHHVPRSRHDMRVSSPVALSSSVAAKVTVREAVEGSWLEFAYVTARRAAS